MAFRGIATGPGHCPRACRVELENHKLVTGHVVARCPTCHGSFVARKVLSDLTARLVGELIDVPGEAQAPSEEEALCCPVCSAGLVRRNAGGVVLDFCAAHGTWFDHGELDALMARLRDDTAT